MNTETSRTDAKHEAARWSQRQRLEFVDSKLYWERRINRGELVRHFGISLQQASADLAAYTARAPENLEYDRSGKLYRACEHFQPIFPQPEPAMYLNSLADSRPAAGDALADTISVETVHIPVRSIKSSHLVWVLRAIRERLDLQIQYQSMRRPQPSQRWVSPHALASDGLRWHTRAWCHEVGEFRDFVLSRILQVEAARPSSVDPAQDAWWATTIKLELQPSKALTAPQRRAIESDFGMASGHLAIQCRKAMAFYYLRQLQLIPTPNSPQTQPIELSNRAELEDVIEAGTKSPGRNARHT